MEITIRYGLAAFLLLAACAGEMAAAAATEGGIRLSCERRTAWGCTEDGICVHDLVLGPAIYFDLHRMTYDNGRRKGAIKARRIIEPPVDRLWLDNGAIVTFTSGYGNATWIAKPDGLSGVSFECRRVR